MFLETAIIFIVYTERGLRLICILRAYLYNIMYKHVMNVSILITMFII